MARIDRREPTLKMPREEDRRLAVLFLAWEPELTGQTCQSRIPRVINRFGREDKLILVEDQVWTTEHVQNNATCQSVEPAG